MVNICTNCKTEINQNYCPNCGRPHTLERIDGRYIVSEIGSVLNFQKGILYTIKELSLRPSRNIKAYISEDRNRLVKPIVFILITSLLYTLSVTIFQFEEGHVNPSGSIESVTLTLFKWVQENYGYANIIMAVFIGLWLKIFFRKYPFNFFEILILLCFVMGISMLIYTVFGIFQSLTHLSLIPIGATIGFIYSTYAIGQFFDKNKAISYLKAFFAYLFGMITFSLTITVIGTIIDLII